jgi:hypothetical protein
MRAKASDDDTADWERLSLWAGQGFTMQVGKSHAEENKKCRAQREFECDK